MTLNMVSGMQPVMYGEDLKEKYGFNKQPKKELDIEKSYPGLSKAEEAEMENLNEKFEAHKKQIKVKKLLKERKELNDDFIATVHKLSDEEKKDKMKKNLEIEEEIQKLKGITRDELKKKYESNVLDNYYDLMPPKEEKGEGAGGPPLGGPPLGGPAIPFPGLFPGFQAVAQDKNDKEYEDMGKTDVKSTDIEAARKALNDVNNKGPKDPFSSEEDLEALKTFGIGGKDGKRLFELKKKQFEEEQKKNAKELEKATKKYLKLKQKQHADVAEYDKNGVLEMDAQLEKALLSLSINDKNQFLLIIGKIGTDLDNFLMDKITANEKKLNNGKGGFEKDTVDISIPASTTSSAKWRYEPFVVMPDVSGLFAEQKEEIDTYVRNYFKKNNYRRATIKFGEPSVAIGSPTIDPTNDMAVSKPMITSATVTFHVPMLKIMNNKPFCTMQNIELPVLIGQYDPQVLGGEKHWPVVQIGTKNTITNIRLLSKQLFEMQDNLLNNPIKIKNGEKVKSMDDIEKTMRKNLFNFKKHFDAIYKKYGIAALKHQTTINDPFTKKKIIQEKTINSEALQGCNTAISRRMAMFEKTAGDRQKEYASEIWTVVQKVKEDLKKEFQVNQDILEVGLDSKKNKSGTTLRSLFNVPIDQTFEFSKIRFGFFGQNKGKFYYGDPTPEDKDIYNSLVTAAVQDANWQVKKDDVVKHKEGLELLKKELNDYKTDLGNGQMPRNLSKNRVMYSVLENQIGILQPKMRQIENDKNYESNDPANKNKRDQLKKEHNALQKRIDFLRYLKDPTKYPMVPNRGAFLNLDQDKKDTLDTIIAKVENDLKIFEVNDPNKNAFDGIKQKVQERIDSLEKNGTDNVNIEYSDELDEILGNVNRVLAEKIKNAKTNDEKTKYRTIQNFVTSSKKDREFKPALPNYVVGNPKLDWYEELYQLILIEIDKITDIPQHELLEDKHKAEELIKKAKEFGMNPNDEIKNKLGIQDKDIQEFKKLQDDKKKLEEENRKLKEKADAQKAYNQDLDVLKKLRQQKRDIILKQKIKDAEDKGENPRDEYQNYANSYAGDPNNKKSELEWYIERFKLTDDEIDKLLANEGQNVKVLTVDDRLKAIEEQKKKDEEAKRQKEKEELEKQEEELKKRIEEQQKELDKEKEELENAKKQAAENLKIIEEMLKDPGKHRKDFYKDEAKAEEEEAKKKAEEEKDKEEEKGKEEVEKKDKEEGKEKVEEKVEKVEEKVEEEDKKEGKEDKEKVEEEEKKEDKKTDDDSTSTSSTKSSKDDPNFAQALQATLQLSQSDAENKRLRDKVAELEAEKKNPKTDPAILKLLENQTALLSQFLKQNSEKQKTTTEKVASGVAKTIIPTAGVATAVPVAMRLIPQQPSMFDDAVAKLAAQGVKFAPNMLQNAPQALAENALPQVVEAGENVIGG